MMIKESCNRRFCCALFCNSSSSMDMLNATFTTRVFEPGGDASIYTQTIPFSPFTSYVGINLNQPKGKYIETDKDHVFDIVTVNTQGQLENSSNLEYKISAGRSLGSPESIKVVKNT